MISSGTFEGRILCGELHGPALVRVHLNDREIAITDASRPMFARSILVLRPFTPRMLAHVRDADTMRRGISYSYRGGDLGHLDTGLLSRLDGRATTAERRVAEYTLRVRYTPAAMFVEIAGATVPAGMGVSGAMSRFQVEFRVPRAALFELLQVEAREQEGLAAGLDACGEPALRSDAPWPPRLGSDAGADLR